jgi:hypothetical protein
VEFFGNGQIASLFWHCRLKDTLLVEVPEKFARTDFLRMFFCCGTVAIAGIGASSQGGVSRARWRL